MEFKIKETTLTDGSKVFDVDLFANGRAEITKKPMCIFSCHDESSATAFFAELERLVGTFTQEILEEA